MVLTPTGEAYSWGCNDMGALGRQGGNDALPGRVLLDQPITGVALGGSHSVFYNTELSNAFFAGLYRDAVSGQVKGENPVLLPLAFGAETFRKGKRRLLKIASGLDHTVALTNDGKVWAWGDAECGKIGRILKSRTSKVQSRKIEQVGAKKAVDIWCGGHNSFYVNDKGILFGWGLNNHGQLGIGTKENACRPTEIIWPEEHEDATAVAGGEHHTIAMTKSGRVYCWGRNDEGEVGVGDLFGNYNREQKVLEAQRLEEAERKAKEVADAAAAGVELAPTDEQANAAAAEGDEAVTGSQKAPKKSRKAKQTKEVEVDLAGIYYFAIPNRVPALDDKDISSVHAYGHYNYALSKSSGELYAWGMGENYVLGTLRDENVYEPAVVNPKMF